MDVGASVRIPLVQTIGDAARVVQPKLPAAPASDRPPDPPARPPAAAPSVADVASTPGGDFIDRNITIDIETRKVVFQAVDERTGDVVLQFPDPRYLKAYLEQLRASEAEEPANSSLERLA